MDQCCEPGERGVGTAEIVPASASHSLGQYPGSDQRCRPSQDQNGEDAEVEYLLLPPETMRPQTMSTDNTLE